MTSAKFTAEEAVRCAQLSRRDIGQGVGGGGGGRDLGSYDLSDDGFLSFFTRCKSSSPLIEKISLNLGKQGWRLRSETDTSEYVHMKIVTRSNNHIERFNVLRVQSFS